MQQDQLLKTKLHIPPTRRELVSRPRLLERLNRGLDRKLILVSAPAGFGKTTLLSEWVHRIRAGRGAVTAPLHVAWFSLDERDNDPGSFLVYLVAALQTIDESLGHGAMAVLQSPGMVNIEIVLTSMLNDLTELPYQVVLVLDDYHVVESQPVERAITFLLKHLPSQSHLVIASRIDPSLPLSRLRARGQMTEIRVDHLRFTPDEAAAFLNQVLDFELSVQDVAALGKRTEGWIAGLQLAALALQGTLSRQDLKQSDGITDFVNRFTGSDHYIRDYLTDEVLQQRPEGTTDFLLQTSILNRLSASLCDAVTRRNDSQAVLESLEASNLFIVPLDNERCWYRYHHLFADLLRQRLLQQLHQGAASSTGDDRVDVDELHARASQWYEDHGLEIEAFQHAVAANDIERAERLIAGGGVPLQYRGAALLLDWLESLPTTNLDARPLLWVVYASALNLTGQPADAEEKLQAAEAAIAEAAAALQSAEPVPPAPSNAEGSAVEGPDDKTSDLVGHIAAIRAMMAVGQHDLEAIIAHSRRALQYLHPDNLPVRTIVNWTLGYAYQLQGDRAAASRLYADVLSSSQASGDIVSALAATTGLGNIQESENQLYLAAESYRRGMQLFGDPPQPIAVGTYLGLAQILYEWNDLAAAEQYGQQSLQLARQLEILDTFVLCGVFLARLQLAHGNVAGAATFVAKADQFMRQQNFMHRMPEVAAAQVLTYLHQGNSAAAAELAEKHELPISQVRVHLARGDTSAALAVLEPLRQRVEAEGIEDKRLRVIVLQAVALHEHGEREKAVQMVGEALAMAEPGGFIRTLVDEGPPMAQLLVKAAEQGILPDYTAKLLSAFGVEQRDAPPPHQPLVDPLSPRELEVLQLLAEGLSNREISERLFLSLHTVKGHNHRIYGKLQVKRRTEAVARARELGLL
jgi:LuxR family maltose regulon positive regulatory protein